MTKSENRWSRVLRAGAPTRTALFRWMPFVWYYFRLDQPRGGRR